MKILMAAMGLDIGGAETHIVELARELVLRGHEVTIASNGGEYVPVLESYGVRHVKAPLNRRNIFAMTSGLIKLHRVIKRERPDMVHAHARIPAFLCGILKRLMDFPLVTTAHGVFDTSWLLRELTEWGDVTMAVSEDITEYLRENYELRNERIITTINGINTENFRPGGDGTRLRRELGIPASAPVLLHVTRLESATSKAIETMMDFAPTLAKRVPGVVILTVGGGKTLEELRNRADEINLRMGRRCLIFTGPRTDVDELCSVGDAFVGVSRAALEAMAAGLPTVIAGNQGYVGLYDEDKLEECIKTNFCGRGNGVIESGRLLDDVTDALTLSYDRRRHLSDFGRQTVIDNFSVERMVRDTLTAYEIAKPPRRVALSGYYGFNNFGDEAILESLCRSIHGIDPKIEVVVLSKNPAFTEANHDCRAVQRFSPFAVWRALRRCELLVSGGGSLLQDNTSTRSLLYYLSVIWLAHRMGKKTMLYANGVGPLWKTGNRRRVRKIVELVDSVVLRDPDSVALLRDIGVTRQDLIESADPVYTMPEPSHTAAQKELSIIGVEGPFVTVAVRPVSGAPDYIDRFAALCDGIYERYGFKIILIPMQPKLDEPVCWDVKEAMRSPATVLTGSYTPLDVMGIIGEGRLALAMRLHALIFAACTCTPTLGFDYDPKVKSCAQMLRLPLVESIADMDVEKVLQAVDVMVAHREELVDSLRDNVERVRRMASRANEELRRLLEGTGAAESAPEEEPAARSVSDRDGDAGQEPAETVSETEDAGTQETEGLPAPPKADPKEELYSALADFAEFEIIPGGAPDAAEDAETDHKTTGKDENHES